MNFKQFIFTTIAAGILIVNTLFLLDVKKHYNNFYETSYITNNNTNDSFAKAEPLDGRTFLNHSLNSTSSISTTSTVSTSLSTESTTSTTTSTTTTRKYQNIIDPDGDYHFILNPYKSTCGSNDGDNVLLIALVPTSVDAFERRTYVRSTWSNPRLFPDLKLVFMLGMSDKQDLNDRVQTESEFYGDILQSNFTDTYHNLTIKTMLGMKWVSQYCSKSHFFLKIDDDVVLNTHLLTVYLKDLVDTKKNLNDTILCRYYRKSPVNRFENSKFYLSYKQYPLPFYPPYCDGPAYILTSDMAGKIYEASLNIKRLPLEDVYLGLVAKSLHVNFVDLTLYYYFWKDFKLQDALDFHKAMFIYVGSLDGLYSNWKILFNQLYHNN